MKHLEKIEYRTIPHKEQRYPTVGDYFNRKNELHFRVSRMSDWRYEALVFAHELIEYTIIRYKNIPIEKIDKFDILFEKERSAGKWKNEEPGNDTRAPYYGAHQFATMVEKMLAKVLKVRWKEYSKEVESL